MRLWFPARSMLALCLATAFSGAQAEYVAQLVENSKAWGSVVADFNGDGLDDLFICGHDKNDRIWFRSGDGYTPSRQLLPYVDRHDCDVADVNHDGRLDMYCAVGAEKGTGVKVNELWLQQAGGKMEAAPPGFGAEDPYGRSRQPLFFDLNRDGWADLYLTNEATIRADGQPNHNHVFLNQGNGTFAEVQTLATGAKGFQCVDKGDVNGDGWDDLLLCYEAGPAHVYLNNQANDFTELSAAPIKNEWREAKLEDMNGDGRDDLVVLTALGRLQIWMNTGTAPYFDVPTYNESLPYRVWSLAVADFDHNGRKDIYVVMQDKDCVTTYKDRRADYVAWGQTNGTWLKEQLVQNYPGCGNLADVVDGDKVLLENGGISWRGPNMILSWTP